MTMQRTITEMVRTDACVIMMSIPLLGGVTVRWHR